MRLVDKYDLATAEQLVGDVPVRKDVYYRLRTHTGRTVTFHIQDNGVLRTPTGEYIKRDRFDDAEVEVLHDPLDD